jgi:hypothetical protein
MLPLLNLKTENVTASSPEKTCPVGLLQNVEPFILETTIRAFKPEVTAEQVKKFIEDNQQYLALEVKTAEVSVDSTGKVTSCLEGQCKNALTIMIYIGQDLISAVLSFIPERIIEQDNTRLAKFKQWGVGKLAGMASGLVRIFSNQIFSEGKIKITLRVTEIANPNGITVEIIANGSERMTNGPYYKFFNFWYLAYNKLKKNEAIENLEWYKINEMLTTLVRNKMTGKAN